MDRISRRFQTNIFGWSASVIAIVLVAVAVYSNVHKNQIAQNKSLVHGKTIVVQDLVEEYAVVKDSIIDTTYYIPLETTARSVIGQIDELVITEKYIVILDIYQTASIYIFNRQGAFLKKIHRVGEGPGEYTQPTDMVVDEENELILLLHGYPSKVMKYDMNGDFIGEFDLPMRFRSFSLLPDGAIALVNEPGARKYGNPSGHFNDLFSKLFLITPSGEVIQTGGPLNRAYEENIISNINFGIIHNQEMVSFQPCFSDTIYRFEGYRIVPDYILDFKDHRIDDQIVAGKTSEEFKEIGRLNDYYKIHGRHSQTDQILVVTVHAMKQNLLHLVYYNKANGATLVLHKMYSSNPLNPAIPIPTIAYNDMFVSIIEPQSFIDVRGVMDATGDSIDKKFLKFTPPREQLKEVDDLSNPILCFFKLRPDKLTMESLYYE